MSKKILILGAGLAGLSAGFHIQNKVKIFEKEEQVGGLVRTDIIKGFVFDYDGHLLHFKTKYAKQLINKLLPDQLCAHKRNAWIYSNAVYTKYPFQANTFGLPLQIVKKCILGMLKAATKTKDKDSQNLYDWMLDSFGPGITKYFMYPYNYKFWTIPPQELIPDWTVNFVPQVKLKSVLDGAFTFKTKALGYNSEFYYPSEGGIDLVPKAFAKHSKAIYTGYEAKVIDIEQKTVLFKNGKTEEFTQLICSLPMIELKKLIVNKIPENVKTAFSKLRYISVYNLNLGIDRAKISDKHWIYYSEDKFSFFRVGFPMNFSKNTAPQGKSSLYAEVSYSENKPLDKKGIDKLIHQDLIKAKILRCDDQILVSHVNDIKYAYVVYDHNYRDCLKVLNAFLKANSIFAVGRFGKWKYMSMEDVIIDGKQIAEELDQ
ncbi:MAG: FAD-dependent oxidoreductase [Candidatus Omnitrophica bacterium]|nr:FAD-dependent oxidoreductase [Candidatus Omnitrophota bacterium]